MTKQKQRIMAITLIGGLLCIVSLLALHVGTIMIPIGGGIQSILNGMGIPVNFTEPITAEQGGGIVVYPYATPHHWSPRRWCIGTLAGAVMQGVFSNPLADPGIMGVSAGGIPWRSYRHCSWRNISRHVLHACLCLRRGLCIRWDYYFVNLGVITSSIRRPYCLLV